MSMKLPRRTFLRLAAAAATLPTAARIARAQSYPSRPVRFVVGFAPGGGGDLATRLMAQWLSERLGQQFVVENRVGASSNLATEQVVRAPADGYTLIQLNVANAINASLYSKLGFDVLRDLAPVASFMRVPNVMEVSPTLPIKTVPEFIAYAKANPGKVLFASSGVGTTLHMSGELFKTMAAVDIVHVPYRGLAAGGYADLMTGMVHVTFDNLPPSLELIRAGKLRALAVTSTTRSQALPELPTVAEFLPGYEASVVWHRRARRHALRHRRDAQPGTQRRLCRPQDEGADRRARRHAAARLARRLRQAVRGRNREVGQGGQTVGRESGLNPHVAFQSGRIGPDTPSNAPSTSSQTRSRAGSTGPGMVARPLGIRLKPDLP